MINAFNKLGVYVLLEPNGRHTFITEHRYETVGGGRQLFTISNDFEQERIFCLNKLNTNKETLQLDRKLRSTKAPTARKLKIILRKQSFL